MVGFFCEIAEYLGLFIFNWTTYFISIPAFAFLCLLFEKTFFKNGSVDFEDLLVGIFIGLFNPLLYMAIIAGIILFIPLSISFLFYDKILIKIRHKKIF